MLRKQRDDERNQFEEEANNLSNLNNIFQQEILKLTESLENLSANVNSIELQKELKQAQEKSQQNLKHKQEYEQRIKKLTQKLQIIQNKQLQTSEQNEQSNNELQELKKQKYEIENARSIVESQLEELQKNEENYQQVIERLEQQINQQNYREQELKKQLDSLRSSLSESQEREKQLEKRAEQAKAESERLAEEMERYTEEIGRHPLNNFELAIKEFLENNFSDSRIEIQFDVATRKRESKFTDFILVTKQCCIIIEAKSYKGVIKPLGDARNTAWICQRENQVLNIYSSWGKNPYRQLKTYCDSLMENKDFRIYHNLPVYGVVVFPKSSRIDNSIQSKIDGFYRVTTLDNLTTTIQELDNQANSWN